MSLCVKNASQINFIGDKMKNALFVMNALFLLTTAAQAGVPGLAPQEQATAIRQFQSMPATISSIELVNRYSTSPKTYEEVAYIKSRPHLRVKVWQTRGMCGTRLEGVALNLTPSQQTLRGELQMIYSGSYGMVACPAMATLPQEKTYVLPLVDQVLNPGQTAQIKLQVSHEQFGQGAKSKNLCITRVDNGRGNQERFSLSECN
jgi:hypothetical protein